MLVLLAEGAAGRSAGRHPRRAEVPHAVVVHVVLDDAALRRQRGGLRVVHVPAVGVKQPQVVDEDLAPSATLLVTDRDDHLLAHVASEVWATHLREGVDVLPVLRGAKLSPVAHANEVEAGASVRSTRAPKAEPVGAVWQLESRGDCLAGPEVITDVQVLPAVEAREAGVGAAGAVAGADHAHGRGPLAGPAWGAGPVGVKLEGDGKTKLRRLLLRLVRGQNRGPRPCESRLGGAARDRQAQQCRAAAGACGPEQRAHRERREQQRAQEEPAARVPPRRPGLPA
mmetsp:Transcript_49573/g.158611  ORF Transcript_49573/g.158611 Transcript_49573/m.158611 type:complete len:284 (+) Transcript_49573:600-1451(+)